jgi:hypothetical protein
MWGSVPDFDNHMYSFVVPSVFHSEKCQFGRVDLAQLVRFLVVELTHIDLNFKFDMSVIFTANYFFSSRRRLR